MLGKIGELNKMLQQAKALQKQLEQIVEVYEEGNIRVKMTGDQKLQYLEVDGEERNDIVKVINKAMPLLRVIESFGRLPGIGPKTAQRLTYYLLHVPQSYLEEFAQSLEKLKKETVLCSICKNVGEADPCVICSDSKRDASVIMVVESP